MQGGLQQHRHHEHEVAAAVEKPETFSRDPSNSSRNLQQGITNLAVLNSNPLDFGLHCKGLCCSWSCLHYRGLCCIWMLLHYRGMCCTWTCLHHRGWSCTLTCLYCRGLYFSCLQKP
jgi:hypothetical protein